MNISLGVMYQVVNPQRVALELSDPLFAAARRPVVQPQIPAAPVQQVHIISNHPSTPPVSPPLVTEAHLIEPGELPRGKLLPTERRSTRPILAPTTLEDSSSQTTPGLAFLVNESSGEIVSVEANPFAIGREPDNHLVLQDSLCSRYHAKICQVSDETDVVRYQLIDVGSSNGTFVEGQRLTAHQPFWLSQGDEIKIGNQKLTFQA